MKKAGIVIDRWKLPTFIRHLTTAGYTPVEHPGVTEDTLILIVQAETLDALGDIVLAANTEAALMKG